jgi:hypothetical protein
MRSAKTEARSAQLRKPAKDDGKMVTPNRIRRFKQEKDDQSSVHR